ncbi:DUF1223 domain-containing protein [Pontivivens insulae]|nr:DUF1223 domain-containing protein [Pontivivens insulae]
MRAILVGLSLMLGAVPATAQSNTVVVELFTSQGCSSCPPADALLGELAEQPGIIALSMHVDYWDYLGWRDRYASPAMTQRQRDYQEAHQARSIFTPQMVIQGREAVIGHRRNEVAAAIAAQRALPTSVSLQLMRDGGQVQVEILPVGAASTGVVHMFAYDVPRSETIRGGENGGHTITYHNVVTAWMQLGVWNGEPMELSVPMPTMGKGVAVIVQDGASGPILAAAQLER